MQIITDFAIPAAVFFLMWVVGLGLSARDFGRLAQRPITTILGAVGPLIVLPLVAGFVILALRPAEPIVAGLILVAAAPGAPISNLLVYLGRGNTALSVTLTALSNSFCILTFPPLVAVGFRLYLSDRVDTGIPVLLMIQQLLLLMLVPIIIGMLIRYKRLDFAERHRRSLRRASFVIIAGIVTFIIVSQRGLFTAHLASAAVVAAILVMSGMAIGLTVGRIIGAPLPDRLALLVEFSSRNTAIAIVIAATTLGRLDYALFIVAYFVVEVTLVMGILGILSLRFGAPSEA
jgi:BASS family bile acid:Na+ symporter